MNFSRLVRVRSEAHDHFVEVDLVGVEFRAVDANELHGAVDRDSASAAHSGAVDHDSVERCDGGDVVFFSEERYELHHDSWADGDDEVDLFALDDIFDAIGNEAFSAVGAVVGHYDKLVGVFGYLVAKYDEVAVASGEDGNDFIAGHFQGFDDRQERGDADAATAAHHGSEVFDMSSFAQRTNDIVEEVAGVEGANFASRLADGLHDERNSPGIDIGVGDSERDAFAFFIGDNDDEVARTAGACDERSFDDELDYVLREMLFFDNLVHIRNAIVVTQENWQER